MQKSLSFIISLAVSALFSLSAFAQYPAETKEKKTAEAAQKVEPCPKVAVKTPTPQLIREGAPVTFVAEISGGDPNVVPTILWSVSAGMINAGQGERRIEVDSTGAGVYRQITADLWVGGYAPECIGTAALAVKVAGTPTLLDQFGDLAPDQENERIAAAVSTLSQTNDRLFVFAYAGRTNVRGYANSVLKRMLAQFAKLEVPAGRVRVFDGGFREQPAYEFWIVPEGTESPRPTPTVDRREIVYPRTTPVRRRP